MYLSDLDKKKAPLGRFFLSFQRFENSMLVEAATPTLPYESIRSDAKH